MRKAKDMSNNPLVSIIVPTYNRASLLQRTLNSIFGQSYLSIEILVVNDCGEDIQFVLDKFPECGARKITYVKNEVNKGLAETRNAGMSHATGDYFIFLDDDDILLPYAIEFRMYMIQKLSAEIVYTRALQDIWEKADNGYRSIHKQLYWDSHFDRDLLLVQNIAPCCCPMFSRKAWDDSGNYKLDGNLDTSEDFDFWVSLSRKTDFHELKLIDAECSYRRDLTQMTGSRNFSNAYPIIYGRWRNTAENREWVVSHQNDVLKNMGFNPDAYLL